MRLRLPFSLRKSVLSSLVSMVALSLGSGSASAVTESEPQNLVFDGATLTWNTNTENKAFTNAAGESASFAPGDNVTFASDASVSLGEDISAGQINITSGADVVIELADNGLNFDALSMLGGSLDAGDSLNIAAGETLAVGSNGSVLKSDLVLEKNASLSVDYAGTGSATSLNNSALSLQGGTRLQLSGCGNGDGKTYTLLTGVSELKDAKGNAISLNSTNNAIDKYFDTSQPGTGFWAGATLQLTDKGDLQLILHNQDLKGGETITNRQTGDLDYQYYNEITFENILSNYNGSAIEAGYKCEVLLSNNGSVSFRGNTSSPTGTYTNAEGGAIYGGYNSKISLNNNGRVEFVENTALPADGNATGGAISGGVGCTIELRNNGYVKFERNKAITDYYYYSAGGAIDCWDDIILSDNGYVDFVDNCSISPYHWSCGGAIDCGGMLSINNNGIVRFRGNSCIKPYSYVASGAIYSSSLSIRYNDAVLFEKNAEVNDGFYQLRSIRAGGRDETISLSSSAGKSIEFRDSVYIASGSMVDMNSNYTDADGLNHKQQGDIIFTGKYTESQLNEVLATAGENRKASEQEILNSRTTEVNAMTNLYGGRLRVEDGAIYQGQGITVHEGSNATVRVKDAVLNHTGYELHFFEGTTLETLGESEIFGDVIVDSTATAAFSALTRLEGSLTLASGSTLLLEGEFTLDGTLTLGTGLTLGGNVLELLNQLQYGQSLPLVSGLDSLTVQSLNAKSTSEYSAFATDQELRAADYFSNLSPNMVLKYNGEVGSLSVSRVIPEPATSTLSLLALTALMSRRRRK